MYLLCIPMREIYSHQIIYKCDNYSEKEVANEMGPKPKATQPHLGGHEGNDI